MQTRCLSFSTSSPLASSLLKVLPEVSEALSLGRPVVALESTILAHGLPYPENIHLAKDVSKIIRERGAIPATIAGKLTQSAGVLLNYVFVWKPPSHATTQ